MNYWLNLGHSCSAWNQADCIPVFTMHHRSIRMHFQFWMLLARMLKYFIAFNDHLLSYMLHAIFPGSMFDSKYIVNQMLSTAHEYWIFSIWSAFRTEGFSILHAKFRIIISKRANFISCVLVHVARRHTDERNNAHAKRKYSCRSSNL